MPNKNFLKLAGLVVLIFFLISFFAFGTSSCGAIKKALQSRVDTVKAASETGKDIPAASSESIQESTDTSSASSSDSTSESSDTSGDSAETNTDQENNSTGSTDAGNSASVTDITGQRELFSEGIKKFEEGDYLAAEYYFNKIKDTYKVLSDHINYYLAKSLLMQEKYDLSAENYSRIKNIYPDSIFFEKANLEYADLLYIQQKYPEAETNYESFVKNFPKSELHPLQSFPAGNMPGKKFQI